MPFAQPPTEYTGTPARVVLPAGTSLFRVHGCSRPPEEFKQLASNPFFGGGRFDATEQDPYPFMYAGLSETAALAETLLRSLPFEPDGGSRLLPRAAVKQRRFSHLRLTTEITLLSLATTADLAAVSQDEWLVHAGPDQYAQTRYWAHWLREVAPWAQGFVWLSKRDLGQRVVILFGDRCDPGLLEPAATPSADLDDLDGETWLNRVLTPYRTQVAPPELTVGTSAAPP